MPQILQIILPDSKRQSSEGIWSFKVRINLFDFKPIMFLQMMPGKEANSEALSPRAKPLEHKNSPPQSNLQKLIKLILPPFLLTLFTLVFGLIAKTVLFCIGLFRSEEAGESSRQFHRRRYEESIQSLGLKQEELGFTNQVLIQEDKKCVNLFLPVYVTCKIKSIQDVSVQSLTGNISCAIIINVCYGDLPDEIVKKLQNGMKVQLNRGDVVALADDGLNITVKRNQKAKFLIFTIRKVFLAFMIEDTLWSPFEMLELVISLTLNTVTIPPNTLESCPSQRFNPKKQYKISFNCMRNSDPIPLSFALDCVYGVYDLAERKLESYHSRFGTYKQIQKNYEDQLKKKAESSAKKKEKEKQKKQKEMKEEKARKEKEKEKREGKEKKEKEKLKRQEKDGGFSLVSVMVSPPPLSPKGDFSFIKSVAKSTLRRLSMRLSPTDLKKPAKKVKYFQYTHLIIPLYKYPGNALFTIFLPTFLLALLSLAIYFQSSQLSGRIGAIATMILGYIALIPSIKDRLPPSSKLTVIEAVVYIETVCCMLILYQSFTIRNIPDYEFIWYQNFCYLLSLGAHCSTFLFVIGLYLFHKFKWEPQYNCQTKIPEIKPADNIPGWDNPYCDDIFRKYNQDVLDNEYGEERQQKLIKPYKPDLTSMMDLNVVQGPSHISFDLFEDVHKEREGKDSEKREEGKGKGWREEGKGWREEERGDWTMQMPTSPRSMSQFVAPSQQLYYGKSKQS